MAKFVESYTYEGLQGKSWSSVKERVQAFKAALNEAGAKNIVILEGGLGDDMGTITMQATFESAAEWGAWVDTMANNKVWDAKMDEWQKDPRVMPKRAASYLVIE